MAPSLVVLAWIQSYFASGSYSSHIFLLSLIVHVVVSGDLMCGLDALAFGLSTLAFGSTTMASIQTSTIGLVKFFTATASLQSDAYHGYLKDVRFSTAIAADSSSDSVS